MLQEEFRLLLAALPEVPGPGPAQAAMLLSGQGFEDLQVRGCLDLPGLGFDDVQGLGFDDLQGLGFDDVQGLVYDVLSLLPAEHGL